MPQSMTILNLERGMPSLEEARRRLIAEIDKARKAGTPVLKIIHGYGSSGVGGKLRVGLRQSLARRRSEGAVTRIVHGENWSIFDETTQSLLADYPQYAKDSDLDRYNEGVTIVELHAGPSTPSPSRTA